MTFSLKYALILIISFMSWLWCKLNHIKDTKRKTIEHVRQIIKRCPFIKWVWPWGYSSNHILCLFEPVQSHNYMFTTHKYKNIADWSLVYVCLYHLYQDKFPQRQIPPNKIPIDFTLNQWTSKSKSNAKL